jgi:hypothetical protein
LEGDVTSTYPLPENLSRLHAQGVITGLRMAAAWVDDSRRTMQPDSAEARWAAGAAASIRQLADETRLEGDGR